MVDSITFSLANNIVSLGLELASCSIVLVTNLLKDQDQDRFCTSFGTQVTYIKNGMRHPRI